MTDAPDMPVATPPASPAAKAPRFGLSGTVLGGAAVAMSALALALSAASYLNGGFGGKVRAYLIANPQVLDEVLAAREAMEAQARVEAVNAAAAANPALLAADPRDPAFGPANAKVTVIEFFDFRCPGCKAVAHDYRALMAAHPEVRFVFKDWPILDRGEDVTSQYAARAALAAHQQGKYLAIYDALMAERALDRDAIDRILAENGVDMAKAQAAIVAPETTRHVTDIHTTAATLGLQGTPTFFINGKAAPGIDPREIDALIEAAKKG
ncbi:disulfide bond formation protein DsbA [Brevundimonas naejangsanensis]|uniref:Disulfide bond formation protein DsbA n=1 Tax=Brevundimonas naejangsanensis TaxID=588932 RepID=A0A494RRR0_9CAUL|nr:thioredoxin domain-containing protein [Brevundimonas naejangsanensis]AYG96194.1 disulfide bond formation protein DsbA [Brevundimonas naejangsanensis]